MKKEDHEQIRAAVSAWAKKNKAKVADGESIIVEGKDWGIEVIPEDGWAYLHGRGSLNGTSTNIASMDEFDDGVARLRSK